MHFCQDFEAITPNLLARTIETVEGGGVVILLLKGMSSLKQLYALTMVSIFFSFGKLHSGVIEEGASSSGD
jgi:tRNA(Met) C34 N-acetyltransferase TmcA